jgi:hypothetical protein
MPYTLSHPLAVVPLKRWCPAYFNWAALVIGSMSPDFGYFTNQFDVAKYAHTLQGVFVVCLPTSLFLLGLFYLLRRPLCFVLPQPHRSALMPFASAKPKPSLRGALVAAWSVLIGALTHIFWDEFTHGYGWPAEHLEFYRRPLFSVAGTLIAPFSLMQLLSSLAGAVGLIALYFLWLKRQTNKLTDESGTDSWRYALLAAVVVVSFIISLAAAYHHTLPFLSGPTFGEFLYWTIVYSISAFFPLLALSSIVAYAMNKRSRA